MLQTSETAAKLPEHLNPRRRLATVRQTAQAYKGVFSESAIRDLVFRAEPRFNFKGDRLPGNGLAEAGALVRIGRRVLIDLDAFEEWLDAHKAG